MEASSSLTVVVATRNAVATIAESLNAISSCGCDIVVVDASTDATRDVVAHEFPQAAIIKESPGVLVPDLWARGIRDSSSPYVLLTTGEFLPPPDWCASAHQLARQNERAAVGGPIEGPAHGRAADWAVFFTRYSRFLPPVGDGVIDDIAGDNALYRRLELDLYWTDRSHGFWEVLYHRRLRTAGGELMMDSRLTTRFGRISDPLDFARARYRHGRHYGATRMLRLGAERVLRIAASAAVAPVLMARIVGRVVTRRPLLIFRLVQSFFWLSVFVVFWSMGEMRGLLGRD